MLLECLERFFRSFLVALTKPKHPGPLPQRQDFTGNICSTNPKPVTTSTNHNGRDDRCCPHPSQSCMHRRDYCQLIVAKWAGIGTHDRCT